MHEAARAIFTPTQDARNTQFYDSSVAKSVKIGDSPQLRIGLRFFALNC